MVMIDGSGLDQIFEEAVQFDQDFYLGVLSRDKILWVLIPAKLDCSLFMTTNLMSFWGNVLFFPVKFIYDGDGCSVTAVI